MDRIPIKAELCQIENQGSLEPFSSKELNTALVKEQAQSLKY